jgi:hypothetical protein
MKTRTFFRVHAGDITGVGIEAGFKLRWSSHLGSS